MCVASRINISIKPYRLAGMGNGITQFNTSPMKDTPRISAN